MTNRSNITRKARLMPGYAQSYREALKRKAQERRAKEQHHRMLRSLINPSAIKKR